MAWRGPKNQQTRCRQGCSTNGYKCCGKIVARCDIIAGGERTEMSNAFSITIVAFLVPAADLIRTEGVILEVDRTGRIEIGEGDALLVNQGSYRPCLQQGLLQYLTAV